MNTKVNEALELPEVFESVFRAFSDTKVCDPTQLPTTQKGWTLFYHPVETILRSVCKSWLLGSNRRRVGMAFTLILRAGKDLDFAAYFGEAVFQKFNAPDATCLSLKQIDSEFKVTEPGDINTYPLNAWFCMLPTFWPNMTSLTLDVLELGSPPEIDGREFWRMEFVEVGGSQLLGDQGHHSFRGYQVPEGFHNNFWTARPDMRKLNELHVKYVHLNPRVTGEYLCLLSGDRPYNIEDITYRAPGYPLRSGSPPGWGRDSFMHVHRRQANADGLEVTLHGFGYFEPLLTFVDERLCASEDCARNTRHTFDQYRREWLAAKEVADAVETANRRIATLTDGYNRGTTYWEDCAVGLPNAPPRPPLCSRDHFTWSLEVVQVVDPGYRYDTPKNPEAKYCEMKLTIQAIVTEGDPLRPL